MRNKPVQDYAPRTKPLPHQREAIEYVIEKPYTALFDEQGLGKTKIIIDAFSELMRRGEIDAALVVAPMGLVFNWEAEIRKHSSLIPVVLRGNGRQRKYRFLSGANFYIANYEAVVAQLEIFRKMVRTRRFAISLDEATRIKDPNTETAKALFALSEHAVRKVIMTGTPIANRPVDLWSQFFFLDGGRLLGNDFKSFANEYNPDHESSEEKLEFLSTLIRANSIRRLKTDVLELPDKVFIVHNIPLAGAQKQMYRNCADELILILRSMSGETYIKEINNILERLLRLVQISSNPGLIDPLFQGPVAKLDYLDHLSDQLLDHHEKLIVWSGFVENIETVVKRLRRYRPLRIHGSVCVEERAEIVQAFQNCDYNRVLVANPAAAREGLTLTRASAAVYLDRSFNLVDYLQSQDRIHRIGQVRQCEIHKLIASGTIDEYVDAVIELKECVAGFVYHPNSVLKSQMKQLRSEKDEIMQFLGEGEP
jgi:SWI/SNF-related matrix-associated actin-dependent regulator of chromatin subfamily A-like protein 1